MGYVDSSRSLPHHCPPTDRRSFLPESDSDTEIDSHANRGHKLKKRARFAQRGQLVPSEGPSAYREVRSLRGAVRWMAHWLMGADEVGNRVSITPVFGDPLSIEIQGSSTKTATRSIATTTKTASRRPLPPQPSSTHTRASASSVSASQDQNPNSHSLARSLTASRTSSALDRINRFADPSHTLETVHLTEPRRPSAPEQPDDASRKQVALAGPTPMDVTLWRPCVGAMRKNARRKRWRALHGRPGGQAPTIACERPYCSQ